MKFIKNIEKSNKIKVIIMTIMMKIQWSVN